MRPFRVCVTHYVPATWYSKTMKVNNKYLYSFKFDRLTFWRGLLLGPPHRIQRTITFFFIFVFTQIARCFLLHCTSSVSTREQQFLFFPIIIESQPSFLQPNLAAGISTSYFYRFRRRNTVSPINFIYNKQTPTTAVICTKYNTSYESFQSRYTTKIRLYTRRP